MQLQLVQLIQHQNGVVRYIVSDGGIGFGTVPAVTVSGGGGTGAVGLASIGMNNTQGFNEVKNIFVTNFWSKLHFYSNSFNS